MFIASFAAGSLAANCYVLATGPGQPAVVVDPGEDAFATVVELCTEHDLTPVGVIATHGHLDHVRDLAAVCRHYDVPAWVAPDDQPLLADPYAGLPPDWAPLVRGVLAGVGSLVPAELRDLTGRVEIAGLGFEAIAAPGHTPGSVVLRLPVAEGAVEGVDELVLTGDVIFSGGVGRTDLPGSDPAAMQASLQQLTSCLPPDAVLLPGHGAATTMGTELQQNPFLRS